MAILFLDLLFRKLLIFFFTVAALFTFHTLVSRPIALCSVLFFALSFPRSLLTLFFMTSCAPLGLNVLFHPLGFLLGICYGFFRFFRVLPLNRFPLSPCGISPVRSFSSSPWPLLAEWVNFKRCLHRFPFSGDDIFLSYLPEFRAKSESASNPLPRSFCVRSLRDFVGNLPDELLLCPVRALRIYLHRTSSLSPSPRSLFVNPRTPTPPLSKDALSFFLRSVIFQSLPSPASFTSSSSSRSSSIWAHSIRGMATSAAFA